MPVGLKLLNGRSAGRDSAGRPVASAPKFRREAPEPPEWLSPDALAEWNRVVPGLEELDLLKSADGAVLAAYCETWADYVAAVRQVRAEGLTLVNPDSGRVHKHPAVGVAETARAHLRVLAAEFGLTPSSEQRLGSTGVRVVPDADDDDNPFAW